MTARYLSEKPAVRLTRKAAGSYATTDGRYLIEYEEWWLERECECLMCQQGSACPNGGAARRDGWTVWDTRRSDHLSEEPFEFATFHEARRYLEEYLRERQ